MANINDNYNGQTKLNKFWQIVKSNFDAVNEDLETKVIKIPGKQLSTEDYTTAEKNKLSGIEAGAQVNRVTSVAGRTGAVIVSKTDVGLGSADNTSDINKPVSTAQQAALNNKVDKITGKQLSTEDYTTAEKNKLAGIAAGAQVNTVNSVAGKTGSVTLNKSDVGLGNVDNTTDLGKPISTATQAGLDGKVDKVTGKQLTTEDYTSAEKSKLAGIAAGAQVNTVSSVAGKNGAVTLNKSDVGLGNVDNTSDANKPVSTAQQAALNNKVDKEAGKALSSNDFTSAEKTKLSGISAGAEVNQNTFSSVKVGASVANAGSKTDQLELEAGTGISITKDASANKFTFTASGGAVIDEALVAQKLKTARTIGMSGAVTGTATSFDGSSNITIPVTSVDATKLSGTVPTGNLPNATTSAKGAVQLSSATNSTSETMGATPKAVKVAYDLASSVQSMIGDINTVLDSINGEVV